MTSTDLQRLRAEASLLRERIRSLLDEAPIPDAENEELSDEEIERELVAECGGQKAADAAVHAIVASLRGNRNEATNAPIKGTQDLIAPHDGTAPTPRLNVRTTTVSTHVGHAWRSRLGERLAAASQAAKGRKEYEGRQDSAPVVELIPGATDGSAALGYLCGGSNLVVVAGACDGSARVVFAGREYSLAALDAWGLRVVEGMSRRDVAVWLAEGRTGGRGFSVVYE